MYLLFMGNNVRIKGDFFLDGNKKMLNYAEEELSTN